MALIRAKEAWLFQENRHLLVSPVLDVGCGDGEFAKMVWEKIDSGIDLQDSRMEEANKINVYKELKIFDGVHIPHRNNSIKTVVANCVLEHVIQLRELLVEINRITKSEGYFLTTVMAQPWEDNLLGGRIFGKLYREWFKKTQGHHNLLTEAEWDKTFESTGWKVVKKVGYLPPTASHWVELWHYLSIGYLISYKITGKWTWWNPAPILPTQYMSKLMEKNTDPAKSGAIFYVLEKTKV